MTRVSKAQFNPMDTLSAAGAVAAGHLLRIDQLGLNELKVTFTQVMTFLGANLTFSSLPAALSAGTFTPVGATSGAIAAVVSTAASWGFASEGQLEFLITTVLNNKAAIDALRP